MAKGRKNKPNKKAVKKTAKKKLPNSKVKKASKKEPSKKKLPIGKATKKPQVKVKKGAGFASNNFNRIRSIVWNKIGLDYQSYFDIEFIRIVKEVYNDCKSFGAECSEQDILRILEDVLENPDRPFPEIGEDLYTETRQYYEILDVEFTLFPAYLWITSPMIIPPPKPEFIVTDYYNKDGGTDKGYRRYFKEFVDWANRATQESKGTMGTANSEDVEIYIKFTKPEYNEAERRWQTEVFICTAEGIRFSFGFVPQGKKFDHDVDEEYVEPSGELTKEEKERVKKEKEKEIPLTPEQIEKKRKANVALFSALLKLTTKHESLEKKLFAEKEKKKKKRNVQATKDKELSRLQVIKKEIMKDVNLFKKLKDKKRLNKALKDLDDVMAKIKKLS